MGKELICFELPEENSVYFAQWYMPTWDDSIQWEMSKKMECKRTLNYILQTRLPLVLLIKCQTRTRSKCTSGDESWTNGEVLTHQRWLQLSSVQYRSSLPSQNKGQICICILCIFTIFPTYIICCFTWQYSTQLNGALSIAS